MREVSARGYALYGVCPQLSYDIRDVNFILTGTTTASIAAASFLFLKRAKFSQLIDTSSKQLVEMKLSFIGRRSVYRKQSKSSMTSRHIYYSSANQFCVGTRGESFRNVPGKFF